jgi:short-subunit dehydrogenase
MRFGSQTVVVITGAASGIGRAIASELDRRDVVLALVDVDSVGLDAVAAASRRCSTHICDVADPDALRAASESILAAHGAVHALFNNAGISVSGTVEELALADFQRAIDVNFWGIVHSCRAFLPQLRASARNGGRAAVCNVLSDFALFSLPSKAAYAASKHAARALSEALGAELYGTGITVTAVYPGATATALVQRGYAVDQAKRAREAEFLSRGMHPSVVGRRIIRSVEREQARVLIGRDARLIDAATRLSPGFVQAAVRRFWRRVPFL